MCCVMGYTGHDLSAEKFKEYLLRTVDRGPDDQRVVEGPYGLMGFGRLAIMGLTPEGMQPFYRGADCVVCNGELYGFRPVKKALEAKGYVAHKTFGSTYQYYPVVTEEEFSRRTLGGVISKYFENSYLGAVSALVEEEKISVEDLRELIDRIENQNR